MKLIDIIKYEDTLKFQGYVITGSESDRSAGELKRAFKEAWNNINTNHLLGPLVFYEETWIENVDYSIWYWREPGGSWYWQLSFQVSAHPDQQEEIEALFSKLSESIFIHHYDLYYTWAETRLLFKKPFIFRWTL